MAASTPDFPAVETSVPGRIAHPISKGVPAGPCRSLSGLPVWPAGVGWWISMSSNRYGTFRSQGSANRCCSGSGRIRRRCKLQLHATHSTEKHLSIPQVERSEDPPHTRSGDRKSPGDRRSERLNVVYLGWNFRLQPGRRSRPSADCRLGVGFPTSLDSARSGRDGPKRELQYWLNSPAWVDSARGENMVRRWNPLASYLSARAGFRWAWSVRE